VRPTLLTIARRALEGPCKLGRGEALLVAVSGGPDSMALLHAAARVCPPLGVRVAAHGVDHGLRAGARAELDAAEALAGSLDVPFSRSRVSLARGGNVQERARLARYAALDRAAREQGARAIAAGHHADDRAETVLIRLLRGAGAAGLGVLRADGTTPSGATRLVRPLLAARRDDVLAHISRHQIPCANDPSNADPRFLRARVRAELLPLMAELSPGIVDHLNALADDLLGGENAPIRLSRRALVAMAELARAPSSSATVRLPRGLVVSYEGPIVRSKKRGPNPSLDGKHRT
jgi:tRNA(Ile)-lysidine synthase